MTPFEKLKEKIKTDLDIDVGNFRRLRSGHWQRASGAYSWVASRLTEDGNISHHDVGSGFSVKDLLRKECKLVIDRDGEIYPND